MIVSLYINLDRSEWRRSHMEKMADSAGVTLQRLPAIDGKQLSDSEYEKYHPLKSDLRRMTKSEVACFLSHRKAWEVVCESNAEYGVVLEDDILFGKALSEIILYISWIRFDMDLIKLDKATRKHVELGECVSIKRSIEARRLLSLHVGCGAYIISRKMSEHLIAKSQTFHIPVDHFLFNPNEHIFNNYNIWQTSPAVCLHQQFSEVQFLPFGAESSSLQVNRKNMIRSHQQRTGLASFILKKMLREFSRPFISLRRFLYMKVSCYIRGTSWERIKFQLD